ncbi:hypothetical protein H6G51_00710 [Limnothrix sp. FACHB-708]|nr:MULTISPECIES: hypothetical protein [unclassified Limnothrix]MBD2551789.1 hypothetical protein [Limnothrix sp. FACHB-708]MBD2589468.1 hypothetical protein [Limnothrix sp. FACHB-406]
MAVNRQTVGYLGERFRGDGLVGLSPTHRSRTAIDDHSHEVVGPRYCSGA